MDDTTINSLSGALGLFGFQKVLFLIIGLVAIGFISSQIAAMSERLQKGFTSRRLTILKVTTIINFFLYIGGTIILFYTVLRPPKELLIAIGGSAAVAIGFALKDIVGSLIAGFILLFDRPFQVGDRVSFGDTYGEITKIGLRAVRLVTLDDNLVTVPNLKFVTDTVASGNAGALDMMVVTDFRLAIDADLRMAKKVIEEVVLTGRYTYLQKPISVTFEELDNGEFIYIRMRVKAYVLDVVYEKSLQSDITLRGQEHLNLAGVSRPSKMS